MLKSDSSKDIISILDKALQNINPHHKKSVFQKWTNIEVETRTDWNLVIEITAVSIIAVILLLWKTINGDCPLPPGSNLFLTPSR